MSEQQPQVVVITGSSGGVGRAIAHAFAKRGAHIGLLARGAEALDEVVQEVMSLGGQAIAVPTDVADHAQVEAAADVVEQRFGNIDVWVNDAMATVFAQFIHLEPEEYKRATEVTYLGTVYGTMVALSRMKPRDHGTIIQVGSALSYRSIPLQAAYCGAKFAIRGFTNSVRVELMHDKSHVHLTMVQLPGVNTTQFNWCRSKMPDHPMPVPPIYQPEVAARTIVDSAQRPRHDAWVGAPTVATVLGNRIAPGLVDWQLGRSGESSQFADGDLPRYGPNLYEPGDDTVDRGARGAFDDQARTIDPVSWVGMRVGRAVGRAANMGLGVLSSVVDRLS